MARVICLVAALGLCAAVPAAAQPHVGARAGVSGNPDQFFVGAHVDTGPLVDQLTFRPTAEVGVGDRRTSMAFNVEFAYWIPIPDTTSAAVLRPMSPFSPTIIRVAATTARRWAAA